jgi:endonuclease/exonuclease/phosphatase family metal-dependent hydrolase
MASDLWRSVPSVAAAACAALVLAGCSVAPVRVVSFNIRYGTADDGPDRWELRKSRVIDTLRAQDADIIGLQEVLAEQADELRAALSGYGFVGVGRDDGERAGEFVPIFYRSGRFTLVEGGHFWLSPTPDQPGSKGWDAALPRMATWVLLGFKDAPGQDVYVINTHFDHAGGRARLESAKLLRRVAESKGGEPVIVMGDFNCGPGDAPYVELTRDAGNLAELRDAYAVLGLPAGNCGTYHRFEGVSDGARIDWVLTNWRFVPRAAWIDRRAFGGRYPSDHFPVGAELAFEVAYRGPDR